MSFTKIHLFIGTFMLVWCLSLSWSFLRVQSINCKLQLATQTKNCPQELTDKLLEQFEVFYKNDFSKADYKNLYFVANSTQEAIEYIQNYKPEGIVSKWYKDNLKL